MHAGGLQRFKQRPGHPVIVTNGLAGGFHFRGEVGVQALEFGEGKGAYDDSPALPLGLMLHGITYADEDESGVMSERLWRPVMEHGVIRFIRPEECPVIRPIRTQKEKSFVLKKNLQPCEELDREVEIDGVV